MSLRFMAAVNRLAQANEQRSSGQITPQQYAALREAALAKALKELASECGVELVMPLLIDANGNISIVAKPEARQLQQGAGCYGQAFADHLNQFSPETNQRRGLKLAPASGRCHMHHLNVEKMILAHYADQATSGH